MWIFMFLVFILPYNGASVKKNIRDALVWESVSATHEKIGGHKPCLISYAADTIYNPSVSFADSSLYTREPWLGRTSKGVTSMAPSDEGAGKIEDFN